MSKQRLERVCEGKVAKRPRHTEEFKAEAV